MCRGILEEVLAVFGEGLRSLRDVEGGHPQSRQQPGLADPRQSRLDTGREVPQVRREPVAGKLILEVGDADPEVLDAEAPQPLPERLQGFGHEGLDAPLFFANAPGAADVPGRRPRGKLRLVAGLNPRGPVLDDPERPIPARPHEEGLRPEFGAGWQREVVAGLAAGQGCRARCGIVGQLELRHHPVEGQGPGEERPAGAGIVEVAERGGGVAAVAVAEPCHGVVVKGVVEVEAGLLPRLRSEVQQAAAGRGEADRLDLVQDERYLAGVPEGERVGEGLRARDRLDVGRDLEARCSGASVPDLVDDDAGTQCPEEVVAATVFEMDHRAAPFQSRSRSARAWRRCDGRRRPAGSDRPSC
jgi:hypothetical protein